MKLVHVDEMVHILTTACVTVCTPMCSPRCRDYQKNSGLSIWTTSWPYFLTALSTRIREICLEMCNLNNCLCYSKIIYSQSQCVHHSGIIRKIMACDLIQLREFILTVLSCWIASNENEDLMVHILTKLVHGTGYTNVHSLDSTVDAKNWLAHRASTYTGHWKHN